MCKRIDPIVYNRKEVYTSLYRHSFCFFLLFLETYHRILRAIYPRDIKKTKRIFLILCPRFSLCTIYYSDEYFRGFPFLLVFRVINEVVVSRPRKYTAWEIVTKSSPMRFFSRFTNLSLSYLYLLRSRCNKMSQGICLFRFFCSRRFEDGEGEKSSNLDVGRLLDKLFSYPRIYA